MPFRIHSDNNDKFSPYWINVERIIATARGHKQRSAAIAFPNIRLRLRVRSHSMSQDCNWVGKDMRWNRRPSCEPRTLTQLFRKQKEPLGSHESINLLPLSLTKTTGCPLPFLSDSTIHFPHLIGAAFLFWYGEPINPPVQYKFTQVRLQKRAGLKESYDTEQIAWKPSRGMSTQWPSSWVWNG